MCYLNTISGQIIRFPKRDHDIEQKTYMFRIGLYRPEKLQLKPSVKGWEISYQGKVINVIALKPQALKAREEFFYAQLNKQHVKEGQDNKDAEGGGLGDTDSQ